VQAEKGRESRPKINPNTGRPVNPPNSNAPGARTGMKIKISVRSHPTLCALAPLVWGCA
jgi:hypothetical protein